MLTNFTAVHLKDAPYSSIIEIFFGHEKNSTVMLKFLCISKSVKSMKTSFRNYWCSELFNIKLNKLMNRINKLNLIRLLS